MGNLPASNVGRLSPTIPIDQSIYEQSTVQKAALGTRLEVGDKVFRYAKAGSTGLGVSAGRIACSVIDVSLHGGTYVSFAVATTGAYTLSATATGTFTADTFVEGYVVFGGGTRAGESYRIKSHGTGVSAVAINLYDPIVGTVTATSLGAVIPNKYICEVSTAAQGPVGVPMIDVTAGNFFWAQVKGPAAVIAAIEGTTGDALAPIVGFNGDAAGVAAKATPIILMLD